MPEDRLLMAIRHIYKARELVSRQRLLVQRLRQPDQIELGHRVLATMEHSLLLAERRRMRFDARGVIAYGSSSPCWP